MSNVISVNNICKKFSSSAKKPTRLGMGDIFRAILGIHQFKEASESDFWALKNISFNVNKGESVALIGSNGSGKSTLLSIIAGIIPATDGEVKVSGRLQALINLGAGFNSRLSGRDNIYNAAAIAGLNKSETDAIYQTIVDFAELGERIKSPIANYSSGMKARLGFSLACHLTPEIMLVDEVLSVGDIYFQNKCKRRMEELKNSGITMMLVSHSPSAIRYFCERTIWIEQGIFIADGPTDAVSKDYQKYMQELSAHAESTLPRSTKPSPESGKKTKDTDFLHKTPSADPVPKQFVNFGHLSIPDFLLQKHDAIQKQLNLPIAQNVQRLSIDDFIDGYNPRYYEADCLEQLSFELFTSSADGKIYSGQSIQLSVCAKLKKKMERPLLGVGFHDSLTMRKIAFANTLRSTKPFPPHYAGWHIWNIHIPSVSVAPGKHVIDLGLMDGVSYFLRQPIAWVEVYGHNPEITFDMKGVFWEFSAHSDSINTIVENTYT